METRNIKLSNYVGQVRKKDETVIDDHMVNLDKDIQNLRRDVNDLIRYVKGYNYEDVNFGSSVLGTGAAAPDNLAISSTNIIVKVFNGAATTEQLYATVEIPHSYDEGTAISPHLHWMPTTVDLGNVVWQLEYNFAETGTSVLATSTNITCSVSTTGVAWREIFSTFPDLSCVNTRIGGQLSFRLFRNPGTAADDYGEDAALLTMGFHYRQNSLGSSQIATK